jgi:hypothetical protein
MLALVLTLILALYILGPDLFSRVVVSLFAPARPRTVGKSEEVARAILISAIPVSIVWMVAHFLFGRLTNTNVVRDFFLGLYGEESLAKNSAVFFPAALTVIRVNLEVMLLPVYGLVLLWSIGLGCLIKRYGRLLRQNQNSPFLTASITWLVRPWVAEWHLKLSPVLLPNTTDYIRADVLSKLDMLFRGTLAEHHLAPDGSLVSITLANPQKFKRKELLDDRAANSNSVLDPSLYWSPIEARSFIIMASEIVTLNLNYVDSKSLKTKPRRLTQVGASKALEAAATKKRQPTEAPASQNRQRRKRMS